MPTSQHPKYAACLALLSLLVAPALSAQTNPECGAQTGASRNVCDAAIDAARNYLPLFGNLVSGGNQALDATGSFSLSVRANSNRYVVPDLSTTAFDGSTRVVGAQRTVIMLAPVIEMRVGALKRSVLGGLAVDGMLSAQLLPTSAARELFVDATADRIGRTALGLGVGLRVAILTAGGNTPGIGMTFSHRGLPRVGVGGAVSTSGSRFVASSNVGVNAVRLTGGREIGRISLGIGGGLDWYSGDGQVSFLTPGPTPAVVSGISRHLSDRRAIGFADAGLNLRNLKLNLELGLQQGKDLGLGTTFTDNNPRNQRLFGSLGLRLGS